MRPPGSNFGRMMGQPRDIGVSAKHTPKPMSEGTKLRVAIQMASVRYPRAHNQSEAEYAESLARMLENKGHGDWFDLSIQVDKQLYGVLRRPHAVQGYEED